MKLKSHLAFLALALFCATSAPADTITWTNSSGQWGNPFNWSPNRVPGPEDTAVITLDQNFSVVLDDSYSVGGLILGATNGINYQTFYTDGQTFTVNGPIQVNPQGEFNFNGGLMAGTSVLSGTLLWISGDFTGAMTIATNGILNTVGGNYFFRGMIITNYGTFNWVASSLLGTAGNITIYNYGLWDAKNDNTFAGGYNGGTSYFNNFGTFRKSGTTGTTTLDSALVFNNSGLVDVQMGTVTINAGENTNGAANTPANASLNYNNCAFAGTNTFTGAGPVTLSSSIGLNGSITASNLQFNGAAVTGTNTLIGTTLTWLVSSASGAMNVATNSVVNFVSGNNFFVALSLTNYGIVNWTNCSLLAANSYTSIYNYGLWNAQSDNTFAGGYNGGSSSLNNFGTFRKSGNTGTTLLDGSLVFNNTGVIDVQSGTLSVNAGTGSGGQNTAGNASLNFNNYAFAGSNTFIGAGPVMLGGNIVMNGVMTASNLQFNGATVTGTNTLIGTTLTWLGSFASGAMTMATNSVVNFVSANNFFVALALTNYGIVNWTNCSLLAAYGYSSIYNFGLWNAQSDNSFQGGYSGGSSSFNNFGTFRKSGNTGTTSLDGSLVFNNTGVIDVQSGTLSVNAGAGNGGTGNTAANASLNFNNYAFTSSNSFTGPGLATLGGSIALNGVITAPNLQFNAAAVTGTNVLVGTLTWLGSSASGAMTVTTNSVLNFVSGNNFFYLLALTNFGTINWTNCSLLGANGGASIYNYGLWNAQSDNTFQGGYSFGATLFDNFGAFRKTGNTGNTIFDSAVTFNNSGTLDAESGTIYLNGTYDLTGGTFKFGLLSQSSYGAINLAGPATLTGTVSAFLEKGFIPVAGNSFAVLNFGSKSGNFTSTLLPPGFLWTNNYTSSTYTITVVSNLAPGSVTNLNFKLQSGQPLLQFNGAPDASYTVITSTNLLLPRTNWISLGQPTLQAGGLFQYLDTQPAINPQQYYQIRSP